jgi:hypothetical protein
MIVKVQARRMLTLIVLLLPIVASSIVIATAGSTLQRALIGDAVLQLPLRGSCSSEPL